MMIDNWFDDGEYKFENLEVVVDYLYKLIELQSIVVGVVKGILFSLIEMFGVLIGDFDLFEYVCLGYEVLCDKVSELCGGFDCY